MTIRQFQPGAIIYQLGDTSSEAYVIQEGQVEITDPAGGRRVLGVGALFGDGLAADKVRDTLLAFCQSVGTSNG